MEQWRTDVIAVAESWLRTPWHHMQRVRGPGGGVDCAQLLIAVYSEAGIVEPFWPDAYPMDWMMHREEERFLLHIEQYMDSVAVPQPGDAAVWLYGRCFSHGAVVVGWPSIIHAYRRDRGVVWGDASKCEFVGRSVKFYTPKGK